MYKAELDNWIDLNQMARIAIYRDETPVFENPLEEMGGEVGCFPVRTARGLNGVFADLEVCDELMELSKAALQKAEFDYDSLTDEMVEYLSGKGYEVLPVNLRGYSQGEWMDVILWTKKDLYNGEAVARNVLDHTARDLGCYFRGDVYVVAVEELVTYYGPDDKTIQQWETVDHIDPVFGNYFDERPGIEDLLMRLEFDLTEFGITDESKLELAK